MKHLLIVLLALCGSSLSLFSQVNPIVKGIVTDTTSNAKLEDVSVSVLNSKDSVLLKYTWTKNDGSFILNSIPKGKYILLVSFHDYADYTERFELDSVHRSHDFGRIKLMLKSKLLQEVLISGGAAIKIKGDTTEFNARSYNIRPNDKVEDLLKQFPEIEVDQNGRITAQGKQVDKVLVDGEEFFGDDPTLVTRNIRADMVDKVQLYDKKSDQAAFTGIDDGKKTKTLNVTLLPDKKNGYFGKADAGKAAEPYYEGQAMFNAFKTKQKFSVYGTLGNTNRTGLNYSDGEKYGASLATLGEDGSITVSSDAFDSFTGRYSGQGIPRTRSGGVHYDGKWNEGKESININYRAGSIDIDDVNNTITQNNLPSGIINGISDKTGSNTAVRQKLDAAYQVTFDPSLTLKIMTDGTLRNSNTGTAFIASSTRGNGIVLNSQKRNLTNDADQKTMNMSAFLAKKFKKPRRTTSLLISQSINDLDIRGYLYSLNNFYNNSGALDSTRIIDQYKPGHSKNYSFSSNLTYSEPISKTFALVLNYGLSLNNSSSDNRSLNASAPGKYDLPDNLYSNNFDLHVLTNQGGAVFNYNRKKTLLNFGTKLNAVNFDQTDLNANKEYDRNYLIWAPQASYQYRFSQSASFNIRYNGNTLQPSLAQLQPIKVNTDPLNIIIGNPDLRPAFRNSFNAGYSLFQISKRVISLSGSYSSTHNPIISNINTDAAGKSIFQSVNAKNSSPSSWSLYTSMAQVIKKPKFELGLNVNATGGTSYSISNNALNKTRSFNYSGGLSVSRSITDKYSGNLSFGPAYTTFRSSLQSTDNNGKGWNGSGRLTIYLPGKLTFNSNASYLYTAKTEVFDQSFNRLLINSTLTKKFLKKSDLSVVLTGNDLLNQNKGFNRFASGGNIITQESYATITRYVMLSLIWDFSKMGAAAQKQ